VDVSEIAVPVKLQDGQTISRRVMEKLLSSEEHRFKAQYYQQRTKSPTNHPTETEF
jgi:deoxycytidine triphosphate deaminase